MSGSVVFYKQNGAADQNHVSVGESTTLAHFGGDIRRSIRMYDFRFYGIVCRAIR